MSCYRGLHDFVWPNKCTATGVKVASIVEMLAPMPAVTRPAPTDEGSSPPPQTFSDSMLAASKTASKGLDQEPKAVKEDASFPPPVFHLGSVPPPIPPPQNAQRQVSTAPQLPASSQVRNQTYSPKAAAIAPSHASNEAKPDATEIFASGTKSNIARPVIAHTSTLPSHSDEEGSDLAQFASILPRQEIGIAGPPLSHDATNRSYTVRNRLQASTSTAIQDSPRNAVQNAAANVVADSSKNAVSGIVAKPDAWSSFPSIAPRTLLDAVSTAAPSISTAVPAVSAAVPNVSAAVPNVSTAVPAVSTAVPAVSTTEPAVSTGVPNVPSIAIPSSLRAAPSTSSSVAPSSVSTVVPSSVRGGLNELVERAGHTAFPRGGSDAVPSTPGKAGPAAPPKAVPSAVANTVLGPTSSPIPMDVSNASLHGAPAAHVAAGESASGSIPVPAGQAGPQATASSSSAFVANFPEAAPAQIVALVQPSGGVLATDQASISSVTVAKPAATPVTDSKDAANSTISDATSPKERAGSPSDQTSSQETSPSGDQSQSGSGQQGQSPEPIPVSLASHTTAAIDHVQNSAIASTVQSAPTSAGAPGHSTKSPDTAAPVANSLPQAPPIINTAKLIQSIGQSEIRVGMRSNDFGNISISTSTTRDLISAQISLDHGELARTLAVHLPEMQAKFGGTQAMDVRIDMNGQGTSGGMSNGSAESGGGRQPKGATPPSYPDNGFSEQGHLLAAAAMLMGESRLDTRLDVTV
jgi:hypothetical protein